MTKNGNPHASSSSLNVNIDHAKAVPETYRCDSCRCYIEMPDIDGSSETTVQGSPANVHAATVTSHCGTMRVFSGPSRERAARAAPASPASSHSDSTLVYEQAYSNEGNRRGQDAAEPSRRDGGKDAGPHNSNGTEYSSDSDSALGEVSEDEGEEEEEEDYDDDDDDDDSEVGGARCDTRSSILERPEKRSSILEKPAQRSSLLETPERRPSVGQTADVFVYMDSKDVSTYEEKEQEQEQEKWHGHQPVSRETRRRPVSFYETRRYSITPIVKTKRYSITPSMAAKMPPVYEAYGNESTYSLSSTRCEVSPTRVEGRTPGSEGGIPIGAILTRKSDTQPQKATAQPTKDMIQAEPLRHQPMWMKALERTHLRAVAVAGILSLRGRWRTTHPASAAPRMRSIANAKAIGAGTAPVAVAVQGAPST
ncbi:hypothetical protein PG987_003741 [Apiospora arundinis]